MILLDTSVVIELVEVGTGWAVCAANLQRFEQRDVHVSAITIFEVEVGQFDRSPNVRRRRARWDQFLKLILTELVTDGIASQAARIVRETAKRGVQLGAMDALIAATALQWDLTVATRDRDFDRVPGLKVEHWR